MSGARDYPALVLGAALDAAAAALHPAVGRAFIAPGAEVAWDDCCGGQVWSRIVELVPAQAYANQAASGGFGGAVPQPCGVIMWQLTFAVGVLRCASTLDDTGVPPSPAVLTREANQITQDAADLAEAMQCVLAPQTERLRMIRWDALGPQGGCAGGEWQVAVILPACGCPDA